MFKHERSILSYINEKIHPYSPWIDLIREKTMPQIKDKRKVCQNGSHLRGIGLKAWLSVKI